MAKLTKAQKRSITLLVIMLLAGATIAGGVGCHLSTCAGTHTRMVFGFLTGFGALIILSLCCLVSVGVWSGASNAEVGLFQVFPGFFTAVDSTCPMKEQGSGNLSLLGSDSDSDASPNPLNSLEISTEVTTETLANTNLLGNM